MNCLSSQRKKKLKTTLRVVSANVMEVSLFEKDAGASQRFLLGCQKIVTSFTRRNLPGFRLSFPQIGRHCG
jgi:hypothetical protein